MAEFYFRKPDSEELLPAEANFALTLAVYFGLHAVTAGILLFRAGLSLTNLPRQYAYVLSAVFKEQNMFYLIHLLPALCVRYFTGKRLKTRTSAAAALVLDAAAILLLYPAPSILNPGRFRNILLYVSVVPCLMTFYTLRVYRLRLCDWLVIFAFIAMLFCGALAAL